MKSMQPSVAWPILTGTGGPWLPYTSWIRHRLTFFIYLFSKYRNVSTLHDIGHCKIVKSYLPVYVFRIPFVSMMAYHCVPCN